MKHPMAALMLLLGAMSARAIDAPGAAASSQPAGRFDAEEVGQSGYFGGNVDFTLPTAPESGPAMELPSSPPEELSLWKRCWKGLRTQLGAWAAGTLVDALITEDPKSLVAHHLRGHEYRIGVYKQATWIHSTRWFSVDFEVPRDAPLDLIVTYWGGEYNPRIFEILVNKHLIASQALFANHPGAFFDERYAIPRDLIQNAPAAQADRVTLEVRFQVGRGKLAGGIFAMRVERARAGPVYRQPWFITLVSLLAASLLYSAWRYVTWQRSQIALARLQQQDALQQERARIARDLHDQIGATLTQIGLLSDLARREPGGEAIEPLKRIFQTSRLLARQLDETIWAIDPENDSLEHLADYLSRFSQDFLTLAGLRCRLELPEEFPQLILSSPLRHHLFLATKEALHNIIQHARATKAILRMELRAGELLVEIEDDGQGISGPPEGSGHDGLDNMRQRMAILHGRCQRSAGAGGKGTRITLLIPLRQKGDK